MSGAASPVEARLRAIIETQPGCLLRISRAGTLLAINAAGLAMFGSEHLRETVGKSLYALVTPNDRERCRAFIERVCEGDKGSLQFDLLTRSGQDRATEMRAVPIDEDPGEGTCVLGVLRDLTERKRLEESMLHLLDERQLATDYAAENSSLKAALGALEALYQRVEEQHRSERYRLERQVRYAQRLEAAGQLAQKIAGDLRAVISDVLGSADALLTSSDATPRQGHEAEAFKALLGRAGSLAEQLLALGNRLQPQPSHFQRGEPMTGRLSGSASNQEVK